MNSIISLEELRSKTLSLGWQDVGITSPEIASEDQQAYKSWLSEGFQAKMGYMENLLRANPHQLFPGAKTAILFVSYYKQEALPFENGKGLIASYARGRDYHHLHRKRLRKMITWLEERSGQRGIAKGFSDSTPIMEKALAVKAGLGWFGKNSLLIHRRYGTFILLSGLLTTLEFSDLTEAPRLARCGSCQRCLDACPTGALIAPYRLDAAKCLSYHLIESKREIPEEIAQRNPGFVFGCDICQDVCPHNARKPVSSDENFFSMKGIGAYLSLKEISQIEEDPERLYGTPLQRRGVQGLRHTLEVLEGKNCHEWNSS